MARIETRQAAYEEVAHRVLDILEVHNEKLDAILEAATREPGPSPVAEALAAILSSLREQESLLLDLPQALTAAMRDELRRDRRTTTRTIRRWSRPGPGVTRRIGPARGPEPC